MRSVPDTRSRIHPVVLCGGSGTRLWPLSRSHYPKQFLALASSETMLQQTVRRLGGCAPPLVLCNEEHRFVAAEQLRAAGVEPLRVVLEPVSRNTAPAAAVAALILLRDDPDAVMVVAPADHVIENLQGLYRSLAVAGELAAEGRLVAFGVRASAPETGFGYVRAAERIKNGAFAVAHFVEKPDLETAKRYLQEGSYYWNSGMFVFQAGRYLEELERLSPGIVAACREAVATSALDLDFLRLGRAAFEACPSDSIDYAVMEKTKAAALVPIEVGWTDVGSWDALWRIGAKDAGGNVVLGDAVVAESRDSYVRAESGFVAALGVRDLVVVATGDAVLVAPRGRIDEVKELVDRLVAEKRSEAVAHPTVYRPWGSYESVKTGRRFRVKHLLIKPGQRLSLQYHHHRAEHWVVVQGVARVTRGNETFTLHPDQSTYVPIGEVHSLENPGDEPLEVIEIQSGGYLGEDDIVRIKDRYGRT